MRTHDEIAAMTARGRAAAEALMTTRVRVHRATGETITDRTTGAVTTATAIVYGAEPDGGPAKVQSSQSRAAEGDNTAGHFSTVEALRVDLPIRSACQPNDIVEVIGSAMDPHLIGLRLELTECARGEYRTADRWAAELVTR